MTGDGRQQKVRFPALLTFVTLGVKDPSCIGSVLHRCDV